MAAPERLSDADLDNLTDPEQLLCRACELEPFMRWAERVKCLDRLEKVLASGEPPPPPPGREWRLELMAERAVHAGTMLHLEEALVLSEMVLAAAGPEHHLARGRALMAAGQALAWTGTDAATARADHAFARAVEIFAAVGNREWQGSALLRRGYSVWFQSAGDFRKAAALILQALETWDPHSYRLAAAWDYYADVLVDLGDLDAADEALDRAGELALRDGVDKALAELSGTRARLSAGRGDARSTERHLREGEREAVGHEWFHTHVGKSFLLDGAELLDRVGLHGTAWEYFERAQARAGDQDAEVLQARAALLARTGDPLEALAALQRVARQDWLEKRLVWRHHLLTAWATFRAGREGAGELAARGLEHAVACGGIGVVTAGEPGLALPLAALAEKAGSSIGRRVLLGQRQLVVRLFGTPTVTRADGTPVPLPVGKPGELVRMLALHGTGLPVEVVLEEFFAHAAPSVARGRLRQVLARLRATAGDIVARDGDHLALAPAWVDVREFITASDKVRSTTGAQAAQRAYAALALRSGPFLPTDMYANWAEATRHLVNYRHIELLDLIAGHAAARGSHQEALSALDAALTEQPRDTELYSAIAEQLLAMGRDRTAEYLAARLRVNSPVASTRGVETARA
jgi:DNA-binding SARP family transcriptional activator